MKDMKMMRIFNNKNISTFQNIKDQDNLKINSLICNTYILLSATILFSAFTAFIGIKYSFFNIGYLSFLIPIIFLILLHIFKNSIIGVFLVFGFSGSLGLSLSTILNNILQNESGQILLLFALLSTGALFLCLSLYVFLFKRTFNFLDNFLIIGMFLIFSLIIANYFFNLTILQLIISSLIIIFSSASILYNTSMILNGTETNYIMATISLYLNIYNIFSSILIICLNFFSND